MLRVVGCLGILGFLCGPAMSAEFVDDFQTAATYNSASLLAPCYGGAQGKYSLIEIASGDILNEFAVSGGGMLKTSSTATNSSAGLLLGLTGRIVATVVGHLGVGAGCPGDPPFLESTIKFTANQVCMYGGFTFNRFELQHAKSGAGDNPGLEFGPDLDPITPGVQNGPGVWLVDDDGDGSTDDGYPFGIIGVDDNANGTTDEQGEGPGHNIVTGVPSGEYLWPGADGQPGFAGVDDDGINGTDDQGEFGWPGSDDSDDTVGERGWSISIKTDLTVTSFLILDVDPMSANNQFTMRELILAAGGLFPGPANDEIPPGFFNPFTVYNYVFCASGTCFGAQMWQGNDISNPKETVGPWLNTNFITAKGEVTVGSPFNINNGGWAEVKNQTHLGNSNFSNSFWVIEGDPTVNFPSPSTDLDGDRDVDASDFLTFSNCFNGSLNPPKGICSNLDADLDSDGDVDASDFLTFSNCFNGALSKPKSLCFPVGLSALTTCTPPLNDFCASATAVGEGTFHDEITLTTTSTQSCALVANGGGLGREVWFEYTPSCTGTAAIDTCDLTGLVSPIDDVEISVYSDCIGTVIGGFACTDLDACTTGSGKGESISGVPVTAGTPIYIAVSGQNLGDFGEFNLTISCGP